MTKPRRISGVVMVALGLVILLWDAYAFLADRGFQRDAPLFLTFPFLAAYGAVSISVGLVFLYLTRAKISHVQPS